MANHERDDETARAELAIRLAYAIAGLFVAAMALNAAIGYRVPPELYGLTTLAAGYAFGHGVIRRDGKNGRA